MTAEPAKFTFDLDMGNHGRPKLILAESELAQRLQVVRDEAFAQGFAEGQASETAIAAQGLSAAAERIAIQTADSAAAIDSVGKNMRLEAILLARTIAKKFAASLLERQPDAELETLIGECLAALDHAPHLVIRCNPALVEAIRDITEARMTASGFTGRLVVLGEPEIGPSDGRLEWVDGGVARDSAAIEANIDAAIATYFKENDMAPEGQTEHG